MVFGSHLVTEAIRVINWDKFLFFLFFFRHGSRKFVTQVVIGYTSCYWLHVNHTYIVANGSSRCFFIRIFKVAFVAIWKVSCSELRDCFTRCTNPQPVAKCEQILCMTSCEFNEREAKPKYVAQSRSALCYSQQRVDRAS